MSKWGRAASIDAGASAGAAAPSRLGRRSLLCALAAIVVAIAAVVIFASVSATAPEIVKDIATVAFLVMFLVVAPAIHVFGVLFGLTALFRSGDSRALGAVGVVLNLVSLIVGAGIVYAGLSGMAAFT